MPTLQPAMAEYQAELRAKGQAALMPKQACTLVKSPS
jgi:hypothetical protein